MNLEKENMDIETFISTEHTLIEKELEIRLSPKTIRERKRQT